MCEMVYGEGNCERINEFTVTKKCPPKYTRADHTRCMKDCSNYKDKILLDYKCSKEKVEYLNDFEAFSSKELCEEKFQFCYEKKIDNEQSDWLKDCGPHMMKLGFMCVPLCLSEIDSKIKQILLMDSRFCVEDYVTTGIPFYDLN